MSRPKMLNTKIFLDSGDPLETKKTLELLGFLDGQTTNPSLIAKNPEAKARLEKGNKFSRRELDNFYKQVVTDISTQIPNGSVSIEVYADKNSTAEDMLRQAREMYTWIPNAHIKFPTNLAGVDAANKFVMEGGRCNMTLVFNQEAACYVYDATTGAKKGDIFISPFIGRLDDIGVDGMSLIANIMEIYKQGDGHVEVLAASIRTLDHLLGCFKLGVDIVTAPFQSYAEWANTGFQIPTASWKPSVLHNLSPIALDKNLSLKTQWDTYSNYNSPLFDAGLDKFSKDWNNLVKID